MQPAKMTRILQGCQSLLTSEGSMTPANLSAQHFPEDRKDTRKTEDVDALQSSVASVRIIRRFAKAGSLTEVVRINA